MESTVKNGEARVVPETVDFVEERGAKAMGYALTKVRCSDDVTGMLLLTDTWLSVGVYFAKMKFVAHFARSNDSDVSDPDCSLAAAHGLPSR